MEIQCFKKLTHSIVSLYLQDYKIWKKYNPYIYFVVWQSEEIWNSCILTSSVCHALTLYVLIDPLRGDHTGQPVKSLIKLLIIPLYKLWSFNKYQVFVMLKRKLFDNFYYQIYFYFIQRWINSVLLYFLHYLKIILKTACSQVLEKVMMCGIMETAGFPDLLVSYLTWRIETLALLHVRFSRCICKWRNLQY